VLVVDGALLTQLPVDDRGSLDKRLADAGLPAAAASA
jgi:hypothetical protein